MILTPELRAAIVAFAEAQPSEEVCGLLIGSPAMPICAQVCSNIASDRTRSFLIAPAAFQEASRHGKVVAVFHSHVGEDETPSESDWQHCRARQLPYIIYSTLTKRFSESDPTIILPYEGRPFRLGVTDCFTLVADYYQREYGLSLAIPNYTKAWLYNGTIFTPDQLKANNLREVGMPCVRGDILLFKVNARKANHGAVYVGNGQMLHQLMDRLSCVTVMGDSWHKALVRILRRA